MRVAARGLGQFLGAWVLWQALASDGELAYRAVESFAEPAPCRAAMMTRNVRDVRPGGTIAGYLCLPESVDPRRD